MLCTLWAMTIPIHRQGEKMNVQPKKLSSPAIASAILMGLGQLMNGQFVKGILYLIAEIGAIYWFISSGVMALENLVTLGTQKADPWLGTTGDNSVVMLIMGIFTLIAILFFLMLYSNCIKDAWANNIRRENGGKVLGFRQELAELFDSRFYKTVLFLPIIGVCVFNIIPIIFMIFIAFTNYGDNIVPPELVDWAGFDNFTRLVSLSQFSSSFFRILGWNLIWAVLSTALNYFAGLGLALLLNKRCVRAKAFWRAFPVLAYAIPGFITLLAFKFMFSYGGPINQLITGMGGSAIGFLDIDAKWTARLIGLLINAWISTPTIMLLASGILANADKTFMRHQQSTAPANSSSSPK